MKFPCPHCDATLEALPEHEGAKADCALCGGRFLVPAPDRPATKIAGLDPAELLARGLQTVAPPDAGGWEPPDPGELSRLLPQYQITSILGRGGMGAVYKGRQERLGRNVAIKLLPAELAEDEQFFARFEREARTLAKLDHPGIIHVYDFGQTSEGHLYFVMEFIDGTDLHQMIHGPGLNTAQSLEIIGQVCEALQFAHSQGVVHRDIKPANILVTQSGRVKLADFGLARPMQSGLSGQLTLTRVIMGTPDYMAPEQKRGEGDHRVDLYALGVMLYEMLCGRTPQGAWQPPSTRAQVDTRLDQVVIKAMQEEPESRYQQASEVKTDVDVIRTAILSANAPPAPRHAHKGGDQRQEPLRAPGSSLVEPEKASSVPRWIKPAVEAACILVFLVGAWFLVQSFKKPQGRDAMAYPANHQAKNEVSAVSFPAKWQPLPVTDSGSSKTNLDADAQGWIRFGGQVFPSATHAYPDRGALRFILKWQGAATDNFLCQLKYLNSDPVKGVKGVIKFRDQAVSMNGASVGLAKVWKPGDDVEVIFAWDGISLAARVGGTAPMIRQSKFAAAPERIWFGYENGQPGNEIMIRNLEWTDLTDVPFDGILDRLSSNSSDTATVTKISPPVSPSNHPQWKPVYGGRLLLEDQPGVTRLDDGSMLLQSVKVSPRPIFGPGSYAARVRVHWPEDQGQCSIVSYIDGKQTVTVLGHTMVGSWQGNVGTNTPHQVVKKAGSEGTLMIAWIQGKLHGWFDGRPFNTVDVPGQPKDSSLILENQSKNKIHIRAFESVDLNGLGEEEALGFLRQHMDVSSASPRKEVQ